MRTVLCIAVLLLVTQRPEASAVQNQAYDLYAPGTASCGTWLAARDARRQDKSTNDLRFIQFESFAMGYLSAYNRYAGTGGHVLAGVDVEGVYAAFDLWCRNHPTEPFEGAVLALIQQQGR
jgi:hypothetical protein